MCFLKRQIDYISPLEKNKILISFTWPLLYPTKLKFTKVLGLNAIPVITCDDNMTRINLNADLIVI